MLQPLDDICRHALVAIEVNDRIGAGLLCSSYAGLPIPGSGEQRNQNQRKAWLEFAAAVNMGCFPDFVSLTTFLHCFSCAGTARRQCLPGFDKRMVFPN